MKKPIVWINGNRMLMQSGHKTFDRQCHAILSGQQIGDVVCSGYVRPYTEIECNGHIFAPGHLRDFDLNFVGTEAMTPSLRAEIEILSAVPGLLLFKFFHYNGEHQIIHGYVAVREGHCLLKAVTGPRTSSVSIIDEVARYVCDDADSVDLTQYPRQPYLRRNPWSGEIFPQPLSV